MQCNDLWMMQIPSKKKLHWHIRRKDLKLKCFVRCTWRSQHIFQHRDDSRESTYTYFAKWNSKILIISTCLLCTGCWFLCMCLCAGAYLLVRSLVHLLAHSAQITFCRVCSERNKMRSKGGKNLLTVITVARNVCLTYYAWIADKCTLIWNMIRHDANRKRCCAF